MPVLLKAILFAVVIVAGLSDLRLRRIPNWLTVSALVLGIAFNTALLPHGFMQSCIGLACALAVYLPLYLVRGMGAGDVKLMAAVGAIAGPANWFGIFLITALVAGAASLALVILRKRFRTTLRNLLGIASALWQRQLPAARNEHLRIDNPNALRMPHGAFIMSGAMLFLFLAERA